MQTSEYREIPLTQGQVAIVDAEDYEILSQYKWWAQYDPHVKGHYAVTQIKRGPKDWPRVPMHRMILGLTSGDPLQVDHIDRNTLNNRKSNLRRATASQNSCNRRQARPNKHGYKGVTWDSSRSKWKAQIRVKGKLITVGRFDEITKAAEAYREAAQRYQGEFGVIA